MCESGGSDWAKIITVGTIRPTSVASCSGPDGIGSPSPPPAASTASRASWTSFGWNGVGVAPNTRRWETSQSNFSAALPARLEVLLEHRRERVRVEVAEVEHHLRRARDRGDHARVGRHRADGADAVVADADLADLQRGGGRGGERVAPQPHRRRARVRGLALERDQVALVAERAAAPPRRAGPCRAAPGPARCAARGRRARPPAATSAAPAPSRSTSQAASASCRRVPLASRRSRTSSGSSVPAAAEEPSRLRPKRAPSSSAQSTSRTVTGGALARLRRARAARRARPSRRGSRRASRPTAPRRGASRRSRSRSPSPGSSAQTLPASSRSTVMPSSSSSLPRNHSRAASQSSLQASRRAPSGPPWRSCSSSQVGEHAVRVDDEVHAATAARAPLRRTKRPWPGCVRISPRS